MRYYTNCCGTEVEKTDELCPSCGDEINPIELIETEEYNRERELSNHLWGEGWEEKYSEESGEEKYNRHNEDRHER